MNCLKCGRTVAEGELLCPDCSNQPNQAVPQPDEPVHVHAKAFVHHKAAEPAALPEVKKVAEEKPVRRLRVILAMFVLGCLVLLGVAALQTMRLQQARTALQTAQSQQEADAAVVKDLQEKLDSTKALLNDTEEALAQKDSAITAYEEMTGVPTASLP